MFNANEKVMHSTFGEVSVVAGPFQSAGLHYYAIKTPRQVSALPMLARVNFLKALPAAPKFAKDDYARFEGQRVRLLLDVREGAGAFAGKDMAFVEYVGGPEAGRARSLLIEHLEPVTAEEIKAGDRVRVLEDDPFSCTGQYVGKIGTVQEILSPSNRLRYAVDFDASQDIPHHSWNVKRVEKVPARTVSYKGQQYDLAAGYRDRDGGVWKFATRVLGGAVLAGPMSDPAMVLTNGARMSLSAVVNTYGPLTKV